MATDKPNTDPITKLALDWFETNASKNKLIYEERKLVEQLKKAAATDNRVVEVSKDIELHIGWVSWKEEEIDPKKLFETNPQVFWELCSIPKTAAIAALGDKGAAKVMRTISKNDFKVKKEKIAK
jgi:hypothetical protein